eukprot:2743468-Alexandrium_andersonii.AAC.1
MFTGALCTSSLQPCWQYQMLVLDARVAVLVSRSYVFVACHQLLVTQSMREHTQDREQQEGQEQALQQDQEQTQEQEQEEEQEHH